MNFPDDLTAAIRSAGSADDRRRVVLTWLAENRPDATVGAALAEAERIAAAPPADEDGLASALADAVRPRSFEEQVGEHVPARQGAPDPTPIPRGQLASAVGAALTAPLALNGTGIESAAAAAVGGTVVTSF